MPCNETPLYTVQPDPRLCALSPPLTTSIHKIPACTARCLSSLYEHALSAGIQLRFLASIDTFEVLRFVNELRLIEAERQEEVVGSYWNFGSQMRSQWLPPAQTSLGGPANNKRSGKTAPIEMHRSRQLCLDRLHKSLGIRQTNLSTVFSPDQQDPATPGVGHQIRSNPDNPATWLLDSLQWHVRSQCLVVSQACLSFLLAQPLPQLREHFQILQLLYFQQAGDWADALVDNLYALSELSVDGFAVLEDALRASSLSRLTLPPQSHLDFRVTGDYSPPALVLEALIETNTRNMSLTEALWHHCHHVSASPSTPSSSNFYALDLCQLNYTIPWPYKAVLPDDLMLCLSAVFTVMLKVRYLIRTLSRTRQEWLIRSRHSADKGWVITFLFVSTRFCEAVATFLSLCTNSDALRWDIIEKRYKAGQFKSLDDLVEFNRRAVYKCTIDILTYCGHDSLRQTVETTIDNIMRAVSLCSEGKNTVQPLELESYPELVQALGMTYDSFQSTREEARSVGPTGHVAINFLCDSLSSLVF